MRQQNARLPHIKPVATASLLWQPLPPIGQNCAAPAASERQVALVLANYPNKDGRLANGVGLDTPASAVYVTDTFARGWIMMCRIFPQDSADLMAQIMAGPTNWLTDRADRSGGRNLSLATIWNSIKPCPTLCARVSKSVGGILADPFL